MKIGLRGKRKRLIKMWNKLLAIAGWVLSLIFFWNWGKKRGASDRDADVNEEMLKNARDVKDIHNMRHDELVDELQKRLSNK